MSVNNLQLYKAKWHAGLTQQNHLASAYATQPEVINTLVTRIFGRDMAPIQYLTSGMGRKREITNREYDWYLMGDSEKAINIIGNSGDGSTTPGKYGTTFRVKVEEKWFANGDVVVADDRSYRARVVAEPYWDGDGYVLTLKMNTPDDEAYMDPALIVAGKQLSKDYTTVPEYGDERGETTFAHPFKMRNHLTTLAKQYTVTRSAATDVMIIRYQNPTNPSQSAETWVNYAQWQFMSQWYREMETQYMYSTFSANAKGETKMLGSNGLPVYEGAGIREQIAPANKRYYTSLTEPIISEFLTDLSYNTVPESDRHFIAFTGEYGFRELDTALKAAFKLWTPIASTVFVTGKMQELTLGGQFTTYMGLNGIKFTLKKMPLYDNTIMNRQMHYKTNKPIESYRFTILDFGIAGGKSNIQKVYKKDSEMIMWHVAGSIDPFGNPAKSVNTMRSNGKDGFTVHVLGECGIEIENPMACGELICTAYK